MNSYLLLRSNKETGPYSLEDLIKLGLKAYDLVWANGKSAAWRYPGEIPELKAYAPAVEEQPFDRFYKKTTVLEEPSSVIQESTSAQEQQVASSVSSTSVFVTLPAQRQSIAKPVQEKPVFPAEYDKYQPQENDGVSNTISIKENPVVSEIKYTQSLDDIKEMYVKTLQQRKQRFAHRVVLFGYLKKAVVVAAIVGSGVVIGMSIRPDSKDQQQTLIDKPHLTVSTANPPAVLLPTSPAEEQPLVQQSDPVYTAPVSKSKDQEVAPTIEQMPDRTTTILQESAYEKIRPETKKDESPVKKETSPDAISPSVDVNAKGERTRKVREENTTTASNEPVEKPKTVMPTGVTKQVSVKANDYKTVAFGGIRDLQLTVVNDSKYTLDNVIVELQYLKPSEQPLKTENIEFKSVSPGGSSTIRIPDTNRGIKISYRIIHILSTQSAKDLSSL